VVALRPPRAARALELLFARLRDDKRTNKDVLAYLEAENKYKEAMLNDTAPLQVGGGGEKMEQDGRRERGGALARRAAARPCGPPRRLSCPIPPLTLKKLRH
jgi:hypothetical protein